MASLPDPPLVSIVIPTYNHAHFLGEAIESARTQEGARTEILVVDDGSADDPAAVVRRYPSVKLIRQENAGLAAARNAGWRHAQGRYVVFLDADDRLLPGALAVNLASYTEHPRCGFVYGGYRFIDAEGRIRKEAAFNDIGADPFATFLRGNAIGMHAAAMYRREALEEAGGFDPALRACEDYDLYLRLSRLHPVAARPVCLAEYRMHGANMSRRTAFMLDWALAALRRAKPEAIRSPFHREAYAQGVRNWRRHYAEQQLALAWRIADPGAFLELGRLAVRAPAEVLGLAARGLARRLFKRR